MDISKEIMDEAERVHSNMHRNLGQNAEVMTIAEALQKRESKLEKAEGEIGILKTENKIMEINLSNIGEMVGYNKVAETVEGNGGIPKFIEKLNSKLKTQEAEIERLKQAEKKALDFCNSTYEPLYKAYKTQEALLEEFGDALIHCRNQLDGLAKEAMKRDGSDNFNLYRYTGSRHAEQMITKLQQHKKKGG